MERTTNEDENTDEVLTRPRSNILTLNSIGEFYLNGLPVPLYTRLELVRTYAGTILTLEIPVSLR